MISICPQPQICLEDKSLECDNTYEVINLKNLTTYVPYLDETVDEDVEIFNMTSLSTLMFLNKNDHKGPSPSSYQDEQDKFRLSLAYERLHLMPKILVQELAPHIKHLDISHNEFDNIDFLEEFTELNSVICDHNKISCKTEMPYMPKLELLWLNHCKIVNLYPWIRTVEESCPNLKYLSLMGNSAAPSYLNGGNFYEYLQYRLFVISLFPKLVHLDDRIITEEQRSEAARLYKRPLLDRILSKSSSNFPECFRSMSGKMNNVLSYIPSIANQKKNIIV